MKRISPVSYAFEALLANEFRTRTLQCSSMELVPSGPVSSSIPRLTLIIRVMATLLIKVAVSTAESLALQQLMDLSTYVVNSQSCANRSRSPPSTVSLPLTSGVMWAFSGPCRCSISGYGCFTDSQVRRLLLHDHPWSLYPNQRHRCIVIKAFQTRHKGCRAKGSRCRHERHLIRLSFGC